MSRTRKVEPGPVKNFRGESFSEARRQMVNVLRASKGWMTGYAEAYVDEFVCMAAGPRSITEEMLDEAYAAWADVYDGVSHNHRDAMRAALSAAIRSRSGSDALVAIACGPEGLEFQALDWPANGRFRIKDGPGEHDPCWLVMPGGEMLALNHHAINGVDQARAQFIADACNAALARARRAQP